MIYARSTRDRSTSIPRSLQVWVSTTSSTSQLTFIHFVIKSLQLCSTPGMLYPYLHAWYRYFTDCGLQIYHAWCTFEYIRSHISRRPLWLGRLSSCLAKSISRVQFSSSAHTRRDFFLHKNSLAESARAWASNIRWKWPSSGLLNPMRDRNWRHIPGGIRDDTCDHGLSRRSLTVKPPTSWAGK